MKISYNWLQAYFEKPLPAPEKLAELISFGFSEVESVEKKGDDFVFDVKVLPDRACYALSHRGFAYDVSAFLGVPKKTVEYPQPEVKKTRPVSVRVEAPELCARYMAVVVENITPKEQTWAKEHLEAVGQRSVNPIVDGANIVMFDRGQPLHAFDADKVVGGIVVRRAKAGEKITTLDNREVNLDESVLIIADQESPLAIAGIKGGKKAEVTSATKNLILESASFDASYVRKASERLGIKTDASKRFENRFSADLARKSLGDFVAYLFEMDKNISVGETFDWYPNPVQVKKIQITPDYISAKLGMKLSDDVIEDSLARLLIGVGKAGGEWTLTPPVFRADLVIPEDIAEEVGRIVGYEKIPTTLPPKVSGNLETPKEFYYEWKIREVLVNAGFSEILTSSFSSKGSVAILKPLAADKSYARPDLRGSFTEALKMNSLNSALFGSDEVRIFEIGRVFTKDGERTALAIGYSGAKKKVAAALSEAGAVISEKLGATISGETKDGVFECVLDSALTKLPEPKSWDISIPASVSEKYKQFSLYPFIVRDIALFVPDGVGESEVEKVIADHAGEFLNSHHIFDVFKKDGKTSYAFRLLFQSLERTLTDAETNSWMEKINGAVQKKGWIVR